MTYATIARTRVLAIVSRDRPAVFRTLKAQLEEPGAVEVVWDRRAGERRKGERRKGRAPIPGRRRRERRGRPPVTWMTLGFVLVPQNDPTLGERP